MGSTQTHRIRRQVVELAGCRRGDAAALQAAAARLCQRDWSPLIERVCSAQVDATRVLRIDRLQVDLGDVPVGAWLAAADQAPVAGGDGDGRAAAQALARQFETAFEARLGEALREAAEVQTDGELLAFFLQCGALPWWADVADRCCVARAATALAQQPVASWRQWLGQAGAAAPDAARMGRLVDVLTEPQRTDLLQRWLAANASDRADDGWTPRQQAAWQSAVARAALALGQPAAAWQRAWWQAALAAALWPAADGSAWAVMLRRWLAAIGQPDAAVRPALRVALDAAASPADADALAPLWRALGRPGAAPSLRDADDPLRRVLAALGRLAGSGAGDAAAWQHLHERLVAVAPGRDGLPRLSPEPAAAALFDRVADAARAGGRADLTAALQALLQTARQQGLIDPVAAGLAGDTGRLAQRAAAWAAALRPENGANAEHAANAKNAAKRPSQAPPVPGVDALYVHNAGLVLLWPFLQRFADRLGLLQPGKPVRWRDAAAAQRAAVLLHCAISGDAEPPEFQLLLPKLLCGLDLEEPLQLPTPLSADEQAECEALLVAAIAQAPILRQMSVAGFRGSFGLREGQLSSRDGHWLLQVERQTFDVVIDRFPWSAALVRLPWMPALLQVQW